MQVTFDMEAEQVDAILVQTLEDHIVFTYTDLSYIHPDDVEWNEKLRAALWVVYEYFAGKHQAESLKILVEAKYAPEEEKKDEI